MALHQCGQNTDSCVASAGVGEVDHHVTVPSSSRQLCTGSLTTQRMSSAGCLTLRRSATPPPSRCCARQVPAHGKTPCQADTRHRHPLRAETLKGSRAAAGSRGSGLTSSCSASGSAAAVRLRSFGLPPPIGDRSGSLCKHLSPFGRKTGCACCLSYASPTVPWPRAPTLVSQPDDAAVCLFAQAMHQNQAVCRTLYTLLNNTQPCVIF